VVSSLSLYVALVAAVGVERLAELVVSARNIRAAKTRGAVERGLGHYPAMVALHTGLLVGAVVEVAVADRPFHGWLGWPMLALVLAAQALRWWCIRTLGPQWSTRVVVIPGAPLVRTGPYRWLRHPNYVAVVVEGVALPLVHTAWVTAAVFTVANAVLLRTRIRCEEAALAELAGRTPDTTAGRSDAR
jgi:methyltransferase